MHKRCLRRNKVGRGLDDKTPASAKDNNNNKNNAGRRSLWNMNSEQ